MNIADRIQTLRKSKGISQEELADKLGVSRQAVSKWESEQSIPDIDKVIILSDYFNVTTDYLLKGIEPVTTENQKKINGQIPVIISTVLNFIGVITSCALWKERQSTIDIVIGLIIIAISCMIFGIGMIESKTDTKQKVKTEFWTMNIWLLIFIPLSFIYNVVLGAQTAPYPLLVSPVYALPVFWIVYISICLGVLFYQIKNFKK